MNQFVHAYMSDKTGLMERVPGPGYAAYEVAVAALSRLAPKPGYTAVVTEDEWIFARLRARKSSGGAR